MGTEHRGQRPRRVQGSDLATYLAICSHMQLAQCPHLELERALTCSDNLSMLAFPSLHGGTQSAGMGVRTIEKKQQLCLSNRNKKLVTRLLNMYQYSETPSERPAWNVTSPLECSS